MYLLNYIYHDGDGREHAYHADIWHVGTELATSLCIFKCSSSIPGGNQEAVQMSQLFRTNWAGKGRAGLHKLTREKDQVGCMHEIGTDDPGEQRGGGGVGTDVRLKVCRLVHNSHSIKRLQKKQRKL